MHGVDKASGRAVWTYDARQDGGRPEFHGLPAITPELLVMASDDRRPDGIGHVYAFERAMGRLRWKHRTGNGSGGDLLRDGSRVYAVTLGGELICLDLSTGDRRWQVPGAPVADGWITTGPVAASGRMVFGSADGVRAVDASSGTVAWWRKTEAPVTTGLAVGGGDLFFGTSEGRVHRLDARTGAVRGERRLEARPVRQPLVVGRSLVLFAWQGSTTVQSLDVSLARPSWSRAASGEGWSSARPVLWREHIVVGTDGGEVAGLRPSDGTTAWSVTLSGSIAGIGFDRNTVYVGTVKGTVYAWRPPPAP